MAKIKIDDISKVDDLDESEQRAVRGAGFAAWLKNRSADTSEPEDGPDEKAEKGEGAPADTKTEPSPTD